MQQAEVADTDPTFRGVLRIREYRWVWLAGAQSGAGDQLARIAIVLLVYARSHSVAISALSYALTFLPALAGGVLLSGLADRYSRRTVMVSCDLIRLGLLTVLAFGALSTLGIDVLLVLIVLAGAPFSAAATAVLPDVVPPRNYVAAVSLSMITGQLAQLLAFAAGGACVAALGTRDTLLLDAVTYGVSAVMVRFGLSHRPAPDVPADQPSNGSRPSYLGQLAGGVRVVYRDRLLRYLLLLAWLPVFLIAPEAVAPAYARSLGGGATAAGLLMAAMPAGTVLGVWLFGRRGTEASRARMVPYLAAGTGAALLASWLSPNLPVSLALWSLSGFFAAYQISVMTRFVRRTPAHQRGQVVGLGGAGLVAVQGVGSVAAGLVASRWSPAAAVGLAGLAAFLVVAALLGPLRRAEREPSAGGSQSGVGAPSGAATEPAATEPAKSGPAGSGSTGTGPSIMSMPVPVTE
ncbi:MAG TPA: MFS transporter [Jatrophihabitans sp.]|nr:MFS transporter [Jatrophihabitans sp.]